MGTEGFGLSDPAMEEALYEITPMRVFAFPPVIAFQHRSSP